MSVFAAEPERPDWIPREADAAQVLPERPAAGHVCDRQQVRTVTQPEPEPGAQHVPGAGQKRSGLSFRPPDQREPLLSLPQLLLQGSHRLLQAAESDQQRRLNNDLTRMGCIYVLSLIHI